LPRDALNLTLLRGLFEPPFTFRVFRAAKEAL